jgi:hypothetical protein
VFRTQLPKTFNYSSDSIKDVYVEINVLKNDNSSTGGVGVYHLVLDTTINLDKAKLKSFINEFNKNTYYTAGVFYKPMDEQYENVDYYTLVFVSNNDIKTYYRVKNNLFVVTALWQGEKYVLMNPDNSDLRVIYKLQSKKILETYNLARKKRTRH